MPIRSANCAWESRWRSRMALSSWTRGSRTGCLLPPRGPRRTLASILRTTPLFGWHAGAGLRPPGQTTKGANGRRFTGRGWAERAKVLHKTRGCQVYIIVRVQIGTCASGVGLVSLLLVTVWMELWVGTLCSPPYHSCRLFVILCRRSRSRQQHVVTPYWLALVSCLSRSCSWRPFILPCDPSGRQVSLGICLTGSRQVQGQIGSSRARLSISPWPICLLRWSAPSSSNLRAAPMSFPSCKRELVPPYVSWIMSQIISPLSAKQANPRTVG